MNEAEFHAGAITLRDRWRRRIEIVNERLASGDLDELECASEQIGKGVYEVVLHELTSRLEIPE
jgi:hypothetical protein